MTRATSSVLFLLAVLCAFATPAAAQGGSGFYGPVTAYGQPTQVFSANPFGLIFDFYNFEYEVKVADSITTGAGASRRGWILFGESQEKPRLNGDVFVRYYPGGSAFNGLALGLKVGLTKLPRDGTFTGIGFDLNQSHAVTDHLVVSGGIGTKRLLGYRGGLFDSPSITTLRLNIGLGF